MNQHPHAVIGANVPAAKNAIARRGQECVEALACAATAEGAGMRDMAESFHRLAAYNADHAWRWVPTLQRATGGAA